MVFAAKITFVIIFDIRQNHFDVERVRPKQTLGTVDDTPWSKDMNTW